MENNCFLRRLLYLITFFSIGSSALFLVSEHTMQEMVKAQAVHATSFVPAKRMSAAFEREILNARIFFIYHVTIQKPGALESGWVRYHNAEAQLQQLSEQVDQHTELSALRGPVAQLRLDLAAYDPALHATVDMVQKGGRAGKPEYDAQVKEWAARGAVMVTDAGKVQALTALSSEASTSSIVEMIKHAEFLQIRIFLGMLPIEFILACFLLRRSPRRDRDASVSQLPSAATASL